MNNHSEAIKSLSFEYDKRQKTKFKIDLFSRLCKKLENESNSEIDELIKTTYEFLRNMNTNEYKQSREYNKKLSLLRKKVKEVYGYTAKNELKEQYMGIGVALGVVFGASFTTINLAFVGIGLPIGLAIGVAIGQQKEKEAEEKDLLY